MSELKELAIKVAEKSGSEIIENDIRHNGKWVLLDSVAPNAGSHIDKYLHDKASEILFNGDNREKIDTYLEHKFTEDGEIYIDYSIRQWWCEDDGSDFVERFLNLWLELKE